VQTWFTSDLHLGHHNIIGYCDRPFAGVEEMNAALLDNWNRLVDPDDTVWVVGDFAMGRIEESLGLTARLHGHKILVAGNHDRCWYGHGSRGEEWVDRYLSAGFERIVQGSASVELDDQVSATVCHFPYRGDSHDRDRYVEHRPVDDGSWLVHGHVHEKWAREGRMINVGVDVAGYRPIRATAIAEMVRSASQSLRGEAG